MICGNSTTNQQELRKERRRGNGEEQLCENVWCDGERGATRFLVVQPSTTFCALNTQRPSVLLYNDPLVFIFLFVTH